MWPAIWVTVRSATSPDFSASPSGAPKYWPVGISRSRPAFAAAADGVAFQSDITIPGKRYSCRSTVVSSQGSWHENAASTSPYAHITAPTCAAPTAASKGGR